MARKSLVGENEMLVATLGVLNASIRRPVGMSNVLIMESSDDAINHLESEENAWFNQVRPVQFTSKCKDLPCLEYDPGIHQTLLLSF